MHANSTQPSEDQAETVATLNAIASNRVVPLKAVAPVRAYVDCACLSEGGALAIVGWIFDPESQLQGFALLQEGQNGLLKKPGYVAIPLGQGVKGVQIARVARLDVAQAMAVPAGQQHGDKHGFVMVVPSYRPGAKLAVALADGRYAVLPHVALEKADIRPALQRYWLHSGASLLAALKTSLGDEHELTRMAADLGEGDRSATSVHRFFASDQALLLDKRALILNGWIAKTPDQIERIELLTDGNSCDITSKVIRYVRPDLFAAYPWSEEGALGFLAVLTDEAAHAGSITLKITCRNGHSLLAQVKAEHIDWAAFGTFINQHAPLSTHLLDLLVQTYKQGSAPHGFESRIATLRRDSFLSRHPALPRMVEHPATVLGTIDRAYPLGEAGVLIFGWSVMPRRRPKSIKLRDDEGNSIDITGLVNPLLRADVAQSYRPRFPQVDEWCGFVCLAPLPTRVGDARALCFDFGDLGEIWLKVPTDQQTVGGVALIKEILGMIPAPDRMRHKLYELFDEGVGKAVETVNRARPPFMGRVEERQYGIPNANPDISVIVPLYGRFDFVRHQLAQFADDADFGKVDLIYVVDDPKILSQTLELAARYQGLFNVPFRVVWYGENRGFAGANNIGASMARADYLMLLNSDVIPQHHGWLSVLRTALDTLPEAGAVGPLLQFGDNSIQHAGMYPRRDELLPGFLLNTHKNMGMAWEGDDTPTEHPMLTAACVMLRTQDYRSLGGFDEGYVIGDFEDSDLCLALRKLGKRLWLAPEAKLWHLERQSQALGDMVSQRQLVTLFNGWRFNEKIRAKLIADPTTVKVQE